MSSIHARQHYTPEKRHAADNQQEPQLSDATWDTWKDGGREPADPDDVGDDGEYVSMENRRRMDGAGSSDS